MNKEEFKITHIVRIPRETINCAKCKHCGEQTCVPYGFGCQYEPTMPNRNPRLSQAQLNRINEVVRNLQQENKLLKEQFDMIYKGKKLKLLSIEKCKNKYCFNYELESSDSDE